MTRKKVTAADFFKFNNVLITGQTTLEERSIFARGVLPHARPEVAETWAMHDRSASVINMLANLIEEFEDPQLMERASKVIRMFNREAEGYSAWRRGARSATAA